VKVKAKEEGRGKMDEMKIKVDKNR